MGHMNEPLPPALARVVIVGKPDCHLCEEATRVVAQVCGASGDTWSVIDMADYPELADAYAYEIPVIFVDQRRHDYYRVDPDRLRAALASSP